MEMSMRSAPISPLSSSLSHHSARILRPRFGGIQLTTKPTAFPPNRSTSRQNSIQALSSSISNLIRCKSTLESLFSYDKSIPEEIIEKPVGLSLKEKEIGNYPPCEFCQAKGAVLCVTCSGSGLYLDAILESQGIMVKVRCLGCGGTGNIMCSGCGGRGHT